MKEKLVIDGNAFYEIDMECEQCKRNRKDGQKRGRQDMYFQEKKICRNYADKNTDH